MKPALTPIYLRQRGFTLVELLVVIAIIAVLAAISIPIGLRMLHNVRVTECKSQMKKIIMAHADFYSDYNTYPITGVTKDKGFWSTTTSGKVIFQELDGEAKSLNYKGKKYLKLKDGGPGKGAGIRRNSSGSIWGACSPWLNSYVICYDFDFSGECKLNGPFAGLKNTKIAVDHGEVLIVTKGPNTKWEDETMVCSWK